LMSRRGATQQDPQRGQRSRRRVLVFHRDPLFGAGRLPGEERKEPDNRPAAEDLPSRRRNRRWPKPRQVRQAARAQGQGQVNPLALTELIQFIGVTAETSDNCKGRLRIRDSISCTPTTRTRIRTRTSSISSTAPAQAAMWRPPLLSRPPR
jgi:hypothetical protein